MLAGPHRPALLVVVDDRVEHVRIRARDVDADAPAELRRREAVVHRRPRRARVGRLPDAAFVVAGLDARVAPLAPDALPHRRVEGVRVDGSITRSIAPVRGLR